MIDGHDIQPSHNEDDLPKLGLRDEVRLGIEVEALERGVPTEQVLVDHIEAVGGHVVSPGRERPSLVMRVSSYIGHVLYKDHP